MYSDPDFSMKLWNVGVRNFKGVSKSRIYHFMSKSTKKINFKKFDGRSVFFRKWGISSNVFTTYYLKRGSNWSGSLGEPIINLRIRLKIFLTRMKLLFQQL
jgi:GT2 family glycosyltransferase